MGPNLSVNEQGHVYAVRAHKVKILTEETRGSNWRKQSASCRQLPASGSMADDGVRCRKTSESKRRWKQPHRPCK